jgi:hypothetical protein
MEKPVRGVEQRAFGRRQTLEHAIVRIAGRPPMRCIVRDISEGGALLDFGEQVWLPFNFRLVWEGTQREEDCETRHQNSGRIGVQFVAREQTTSGRGGSRLGDASQWIADQHSTTRR